MIFCLVFAGACSLASSETLAKAAPKLSSTSIMLVAGGQKTINLTGGKGSWSIDDESIAAIKSSSETSIVITPVHSGTTKLNCNVNNKTLTCRINVLNNEIGSPSDLAGPDDQRAYMYKGKSITMYWEDISNSSSNEAAATLCGISSSEGDNISLIPENDEDYADDDFDYDDENEDNYDDDPIISVGHDPNFFKRIDKNGTTNYKAIRTGKTTLEFVFQSGREQSYPVCIINPLRGKTKVKNTAANYRKWRNKWIKDYMTPETTTWELIEGIGYLGESGRYRQGKKKMTPQYYWYTGNGTCASGARLFTDFLTTVGVSSKVHNAANDLGGEDMWGYNVMYMSDHKTAQVKLGGKKYTINSQPQNMWPVGLIEGWE